MSHSYRTIPDAKLEFGIFSILEILYDAQTFPLKRGEQVIEFVYLPPGSGLKLLKNEVFYVQGHSFQPKIDPLSTSAISKQKKFLHFQNVLDVSRKK